MLALITHETHVPVLTFYESRNRLLGGAAEASVPHEPRLDLFSNNEECLALSRHIPTAVFAITELRRSSATEGDQRSGDRHEKE